MDLVEQQKGRMQRVLVTTKAGYGLKILQPPKLYHWHIGVFC